MFYFAKVSVHIDTKFFRYFNITTLCRTIFKKKIKIWFQKFRNFRACARLQGLTRGHECARSIEINYDMICQPGRTAPWQTTRRQMVLTTYSLPV